MASLKQFLNDKSNKSEIDEYFENQAKFLLEKQKLETIDNFNGYFDFLNNEFPCPVYYDGLIYRTVSHAFQAARSTEQHIREKIVRADTVMEMYEIAAKIEDPPDWIKMRLKVMETLVRDKFRRTTELREKLRATETRRLINTYADPSASNLFWGKVDGEGQNQLGVILEHIRNDIHHNIELEKWLFMTFKLEDTKQLLPKLQLDVIKGDSKVETINLDGKSYYFMGKVMGSEVLMTHASISRRHAALICDSNMGVCLLDLGSKAGSFLNNQKMDNCFPYRLKPGDILHFGASTRRYKIAIDYSDVERYLRRKQKEVKQQYEKMDTLNDPGANVDLLKASLGVIINDQIFVGGLPENTAYKELETLFSQFGEVKNVRIPTDRKTGKTRTFALITFKDPKECEKAIGNDGLKFKDRRLKIKWAEKREFDDREEDRGRYVKAVKGNEDRIDRDVSRRHKRRSRSPRDSRRRRHERDDRRGRNRSREKRREKKKSRSSSGSSDSESESKSKSREREKNRKEKKDGEKEKRKEKDERKEGKEKKKEKSKSKSESSSRSRSRSKDRNDKKNGANKKRTKSQEKDAKNKEARKKKDKSESESKSGSGSSSDSGSDSSEDSGKGK